MGVTNVTRKNKIDLKMAVSGYPKFYQNDLGNEQIKLVSPVEQTYVRAVKTRHGFDYCAYRNQLVGGEEYWIAKHYRPSCEENYMRVLKEAIQFFEGVKTKLNKDAN